MKLLRQMSFSNNKEKDNSKKIIGAGVGLGAGAVGTRLAECGVLDEIATKPVKHAAKIARIKQDSKKLAAEILEDRVSREELNKIGEKVNAKWYVKGWKRDPGDTASRIIGKANSKIERETINLPEKLANLKKKAQNLNRATEVLSAAAIGVAGYGAYKHYRNKKKNSNRKEE
jgi:predicted HTH transcriptional regulator